MLNYGHEKRKARRKVNSLERERAIFVSSTALKTCDVKCYNWHFAFDKAIGAMIVLSEMVTWVMYSYTYINDEPSGEINDEPSGEINDEPSSEMKD